MMSHMEDPVVEKKLLMEYPPSSSSDSEDEDIVKEEAKVKHESLFRRRILSKQLSMRETSREAKWEERRRQIINGRKKMMSMGGEERENNAENVDEEEEARSRRERVRSLTDEDLDELRGSIELGFGFDEENGGHDLCDTLPALNLYFAVNRQLSDPKMGPGLTPMAESYSSAYQSPPSAGRSPRSPHDHNMDDWKIVNPGDNPQHVKTRLRHWAQIVACSVKQNNCS